MRRLIILFALTYPALGCIHRYGSGIHNYPVSQQAGGISITLKAVQRDFESELIEVRETGLVVFADGKLWLLPYASILSSEMDWADRSPVKGRRPPARDVRERLRLVSRFPQGLAPELLQQLLREYGQTELGGAQDESPSSFLERALIGTEKYRDQSFAILEGYRRIGRDFPAMGEHWIRIGLLFDGTFDAARPEVLTYINVSGKPQLLGVAYALPLKAGETAPDWPADQEAWHDHFRTLDEETLLPHHQAQSDARDAPRLTMLHAWIWSENPDGVFAADNWAIPYLRLGIKPSQNAPVEAAKALSLVTGGSEFFSTSIDPAALDRARLAAESVLRDRSNSDLTEAEVGRLAEIWMKIGLGRE